VDKKLIKFIMNMKTILFGICCGAALVPAALNAQVVFSDVGMTDAANWTVNASALNSNPFDYVANFGFNYNTVEGVPIDPYSSSTTALQLKINETSGNQAGVSVSPTSFGLSGNFTMTFDMWLNYNSGGFTTGSTQVGSYGITTAANQAQWAGVGNGQLFGEITDNGSSTSYRGYNGGASIGATPFVGGSQSFTSAYHVGLFPSVNVPATETAINANEYGSTVAGTVGFQWLQVSVSDNNNLISESINGNLIASYTASSVGDDIFLGMYDINNGSAGVSGIADENFALFDNLVVTVPEPTTCTLAVLGGSMLLARLRSRKS
jgi:hypothetical protein